MTEKDIEKRETMIWEGQHDFHEFIIIANTLEYKHIVQCFPTEEGQKENLGAACRDEDETYKTIKMFSDAGYSSRTYNMKDIQ